MLKPAGGVASREGGACLTAGFGHPRNVPSIPRLPLLAAFVALIAPAVFSAEPPRLAVVIVVDQFRGDYLARFGPHFSDGGFRRLLANGVNYTRCHYRHAITLTAPGHATVLTGTTPDVHGITANEWLDRATWEMRNCVEDPASPLVGIAPAELGPVAAAAPDKTGRSPRPLLAATVSDELKKHSGAKARVFAVSNKDRSAILLGGQQADGAYWDENGRFVTSRHYRPDLPAWVRTFNAEGRVVARFGATWDRLLEREVYDRTQGPDDEAGEADTAGLGRTFPRRITGGLAKPGPAFFTAFDNSPFSAEFLGEFARRVVTEEKLGRGEATDLLCVSFSQVDTAGHNYGPDSHEVMDSVVRLDRTLAMLLEHLDREVGLARCVFAFTADHGIMPLPERVLRTQPGIPAGRVKPAEMDAAAVKALEARFGAAPKGETWFTRDNAGIHLRPAALAARGATAPEAARVVRDAWATLPYMAAVHTREELLAAKPDAPGILGALRRSYRREGDRDVVYAFKPNFVAKSGAGVSHGSPHDYETHVPLVFSGPGVPRGRRDEQVSVEDLAPTLSALLGVPVPATATGRRLF